MTLQQLIDQFRSDVDDRIEDYLFSDADVIGWLNEAEREAALRANLIFDATTSAVCEIAVTAGTNVYPMHSAIFVIERASFLADGADAEDAVVLDIVGRLELNRLRPNWRTTEEAPSTLIVDDKTVQIGCLPSENGTLSLEVYRAPLTPMVLGDGDPMSPEIALEHHRHLVEWAKYRAFSRPDAEVFDPKRAEQAEAIFTRQFGPRPDADQRRATYASQPHATRAWV